MTMSDPTVPADGTRVRVNRGAMVGVPEGTPAVVRHQAPGGHSNLPRLVWLELEEPIQWSHGHSEHPGFWASPVEFTIEPEPEVDSRTVTHLAGAAVEYQHESGRILRQRCSWCGALLVDENLDRIAVPVGQEGPIPTWELGRFVDVVSPDGRGGVWSLNDWTTGAVPQTACMRMPPEATA